jgi:hypothetical protein
MKNKNILYIRNLIKSKYDMNEFIGVLTSVCSKNDINITLASANSRSASIKIPKSVSIDTISKLMPSILRQALDNINNNISKIIKNDIGFTLHSNEMSDLLTEYHDQIIEVELSSEELAKKQIIYIEYKKSNKDQ